MPRNSSGVYQLPAGNPVASGTLIESDWANTSLSDMANALTESLDRFGRSTMASPLLLADGAVAAPALSFGAEASTGLFRKSAKVLGVAVGATEVATFTQTGVTFPLGVTVASLSTTGNLTVNGTLTATGLITASNGITLGAGKTIAGSGTTSGSWQLGPNNSTGNLELAAAAATGIAANIDIDPTVADGTSGASVRLFRTTNTTGARSFQILRGDNTGTIDHQLNSGATGVQAQIARNGGRVLLGTTGDNTIDALQIVPNARVRQGASGVGSNAAALAGYDEFVIEGNGAVGMSFLSPNNVNCGIAWGDPQGLGQGFILYNHTADQLQLGAATTTNLILDAAYARSTLPFYIPDGTAAAPSLGFMTQATWGMFRVPAIGIGFTVAGVEAARIAAAGMTFSAGAVGVFHNDTTTNLSICAAASLIDGVARVDLYDSAHATLPRQITVRGRGIVFTDSTTATEKGRFTTATGQAEFLVGVSTGGPFLSAASRGLIEVSGATTTYIGLDVANANRGYIAASGASFVMSSATTAIPVIFSMAGTEVARVETDSSLQYTAPTIGQFEVGFRAIPVQSKSAAYTMRSVDRGCCVVQTAVANVITAAVFGAGDVVTVCNKSSGAIGLVATGITLNWGTGTVLTGNRTLAVNALVTLYFTAANVATLNGTGIS